MVSKKTNAKTLMDIFFGIVLVLVFIGFVFAAITVIGMPVANANYSSSITININYTNGSADMTDATVANTTCYYNASGVWASVGTLSNFEINATGFNATIDLSLLNDGTGISFNCSVGNDTDSLSSDRIDGITIDSTPPAVNFSDTTSSVVNYGNYTSANAGTININVSFSDAIWTNYGISGANVYINVTNSSGGRAPRDNFTRALNETTNTFFNTTINVTDYPDGKYNVTIWANDSIYLKDSTDTVSANLNNTEYIQITIDDTAPSSVTLTSGTGTTTTQNVVTITAVDATSGIDNCVVSSSDIASNIAITGRGTGTQTLTQTGLNCATSYKYIVTCYDQAGNSKASIEKSFSTSSCSGNGGGNGETTAIENVNILNINPESEATLSNFEEDMGVEEIKITVTEEANNVKVTVKKFDTQPAEITVSKTGNVHRYLQITSQNLGDKLERAILTIKVQKNWLLDNEVDKANIALFKLDESAGAWNELSTVYKSEDDDYYYYDVELTSFSYFAIGEKVIDGEEPGLEGNLLWLWIAIGIVVVAVIIGGGFAAKKKRK